MLSNYEDIMVTMTDFARTAKQTFEELDSPKMVMNRNNCVGVICPTEFYRVIEEVFHEMYKSGDLEVVTELLEKNDHYNSVDEFIAQFKFG